MLDFLQKMTTIPGTSGYEQPVAKAFADAFFPYVDSVHVDEMGSMTAVRHGTGKGPRIMLTAHIDEVGLMTTLVEEDGSIRFATMGVSAQILPAQEVTLLTAGGPLYGVIGAVPPHVLTQQEQEKAVQAKDLFIDVGLPADRVRKLVPPGTPVQLVGRVTELAGKRVASKTLDDRACAGILLECAKELSRMTIDAEVYYLLAAREEFDSLGAETGTEAIRPDMAFVLDVTHGTMENCAPGETYPLDATTLACGPNLHKGLTDRVREKAKQLRMKVVTEVAAGNTWTDAWAIQVACEGVPCVLMSLPIKYMHTIVELASLELMQAQAHLLAQVVSELDERWEGLLCC